MNSSVQIQTNTWLCWPFLLRLRIMLPEENRKILIKKGGLPTCQLFTRTLSTRHHQTVSWWGSNMERKAQKQSCWHISPLLQSKLFQVKTNLTYFFSTSKNVDHLAHAQLLTHSTCKNIWEKRKGKRKKKKKGEPLYCKWHRSSTLFNEISITAQVCTLQEDHF